MERTLWRYNNRRDGLERMVVLGARETRMECD